MLFNRCNYCGYNRVEVQCDDVLHYYARILIKVLTRLLLTTEDIYIIILFNRWVFALFTRRYSGNGTLHPRDGT